MYCGFANFPLKNIDKNEKRGICRKRKTKYWHFWSKVVEIRTSYGSKLSPSLPPPLFSPAAISLNIKGKLGKEGVGGNNILQDPFLSPSLFPCKWSLKFFHCHIFLSFSGNKLRVVNRFRIEYCLLAFFHLSISSLLFPRAINGD